MINDGRNSRFVISFQLSPVLHGELEESDARRQSPLVPDGAADGVRHAASQEGAGVRPESGRHDPSRLFHLQSHIK